MRNKYNSKKSATIIHFDTAQLMRDPFCRAQDAAILACIGLTEIVGANGECLPSQKDLDARLNNIRALIGEMDANRPPPRRRRA
jgi:hypothetical protein